MASLLRAFSLHCGRVALSPPFSPGPCILEENDMRIRKTLIASAALVALGLTGQAWAQQSNGDGNGGDDILVNANIPIDASNSSAGDNRDNDGRARADGLGTAAANNGGMATSNVYDAFNTSNAVATTVLNGAVTDIRVRDIGNVADNSGNANGGDGGAGGAGLGGIALGGAGDGGRGGDGGNATGDSGRAADGRTCS